MFQAVKEKQPTTGKKSLRLTANSNLRPYTRASKIPYLQYRLIGRVVSLTIHNNLPSLLRSELFDLGYTVNQWSQNILDAGPNSQSCQHPWAGLYGALKTKQNSRTQQYQSTSIFL